MTLVKGPAKVPAEEAQRLAWPVACGSPDSVGQWRRSGSGRHWRSSVDEAREELRAPSAHGLRLELVPKLQAQVSSDEAEEHGAEHFVQLTRDQDGVF